VVAINSNRPEETKGLFEILTDAYDAARKT
jgi:hypothetical protein